MKFNKNRWKYNENKIQSVFFQYIIRKIKNTAINNHFHGNQIIFFSNIFHIQDIFSQYLFILEELGLSGNEVEKEKGEKMRVMEKLITTFGNRVITVFIHPTIKIRKIVFQSTLSMNEALSTKFGGQRKNPLEIALRHNIK